MTERPPGIVTPEAVVLEFETAGIGSRLLALLIDLALQAIALMGVLLLLATLTAPFGGGPPTLVVVVALLLAFVVLVGYPALAEAAWDGRTVGKMTCRLRVVTREGAPVRFRHTAIRAVLRLFEIIILFGGPAVVAVLLTRDDQRLGDLAAGTIVLREPAVEADGRAVLFPPLPGYEAYVASLDVAALSSEEYGLVRAFLLRTPRLTPAARAALGVRLAGPVAARLHHQPPPGLHPEAFLASVAAAYQARHGAPGVVPPAPSGPPPFPPPPTAPNLAG